MVDTGAGWGSGRDAEGLVLLPTGAVVPEIEVSSQYKGQRWKYNRCRVPLSESGVVAEGPLLPTGAIVPEIQVGSQYEGERWKYGACRVPGQGTGVDAEGPLLPTGAIVPERYVVSMREKGGGMVDVGYTWVGKWSRCWVASAVFNWSHCS